MVNKPPPQFLSALRKGITDGFSLNELQILCADLGVEYQDLSGDTKQIKALELVEYMNHRGRLGELLEYCVSLRPQYPWPQATAEEEKRAKRPVRILFLAANPKDTDQLRLDEEIRSIDEALLQKAKFGDMFDLKQQWAVRVSDLQGHFLRYRPDIVHFSGHGSTASEIILEDNSGNSQAVSKHALSQLFSVLKDNVRCVVLNACYSEPQARAIAEHIDCVIGMSKAIGDDAAIQFTQSFYQALGYGQDIETAFKLGTAQIALQGLNEQVTPKLLALNSNPKDIIFVPAA